MLHFQTQIPALFIIGLIFSMGCNSLQKKSQNQSNNIKAVNSKLARPLKIGDKIEFSGGYDYDPLYLKNPPSSKRSGTLIQFIKGQDEDAAAVVKLDQKISGQKITETLLYLSFDMLDKHGKSRHPFILSYATLCQKIKHGRKESKVNGLKPQQQSHWCKYKSDEAHAADIGVIQLPPRLYYYFTAFLIFTTTNFEVGVLLFSATLLIGTNTFVSGK